MRIIEPFYNNASKQVMELRSSLSVMLSSPIASSAIRTLFVAEFRDLSAFVNTGLVMPNIRNGPL